ncbi:hypothetical protein [Brevibacillus laterosporus]|uniref:hypothetical protein n=1 Tax=Brevibacillus laterosporus TaxID=1465 RepID=UPI003D1A523A
MAIARASLSKAPIVLFDEPTSALDSHSESCVRDAIRSLKDQRTVMIVTHQMQTAEIANVIFVMEQGSIVDTVNSILDFFSIKFTEIHIKVHKFYKHFNGRIMLICYGESQMFIFS